MVRVEVGICVVIGVVQAFLRDASDVIGASVTAPVM
jgi:hypothetical protein